MDDPGVSSKSDGKFRRTGGRGLGATQVSPSADRGPGEQAPGLA
jgi:hypothetical protein